MLNLDFKCIENKINYVFKDKNLLASAFVHSSYSNEHNHESNERLEFLGDSVLQLIVTENIFSSYKKNEGELSKIRASLVSEKSLSFIFEQLGLDKFILTGAGLKNTKPTRAMMADAFEALVASIYLDGGYFNAKKFVLSVLKSALAQIKKFGVPDSYKSKLQEKFKTAKIVYDTKSSGEGQDKTYTSKVFINGVMCGIGTSGKKREAEELSAFQALDSVKKA